MFMNPMGMRRGGGGRRGGIGLLMLAAQVQRFGLQNIPGVTLAILVANVGAFLTDNYVLSVWGSCFSYEAVVLRGELSRMLKYAFVHANDWHLAYNMSSLLWKGYNLERAMGTAKYLALVVYLMILTPLIHLGLVWGLLQVGLDKWGLWRECAVGFSGVLFGMKVLLTLNSDRMHDVFFGLFKVEGRYVVWAELILIHYMYPSTSFMSHLSGILAGLLYAEGLARPLLTPLESLSQKLLDALTVAQQQAARAQQQHQQGYYQQDRHRDEDYTPPNPAHRDEAARRDAAEAARRRWNAGR